MGVRKAVTVQVATPRVDVLFRRGDKRSPTADGVLSSSAPPAESMAAARGAGGLARAFSRQLSRALLSEPAAAPAADTPDPRKLGSLQAYAPHDCDASEMGPPHFAADNVHRIGILDMRLLNCDRHTGNLLVQQAPRVPSAAPPAAGRAPYTLIPIDHGFALPEALDNPFFEWLYWPQTSVPFSAEVRAYVAGLDAAADVAMLRERVPGLREECLRCLEATTKARVPLLPA